MNPQVRVCPNCSNANRMEVRFCTACGVLLEPRACARCGVAARSGDRYCGACGGFLSAESAPAEKKPQPAGAPAAKEPAPARPAASPPPELEGAEAETYERLRRWRTEQSGLENVPRYAVLNNAQLAEIAKTKPATQAALASVKGVGAAKALKYFEPVRKILGLGGEVKEAEPAYA